MMRRLKQVLSACLAAMVLAAGLLAVPMACAASNSKCAMGCGMEMSSGDCCCHVDQQNSGSEPAKAGANLLPPAPKFWPVSTALTYNVAQAVPLPGSASQRALNLPPTRGGLAFLGIFLI